MEVTPRAIRLRKRVLAANVRPRRKAEGQLSGVPGSGYNPGPMGAAA